MTNFRKPIIYRMGFTFIFFTTCLYLAWFTWPLKSISFQEVFKREEIKKTNESAAQCNKRVQVIGSNENNLYLNKVLNKKVLNDFVMVKKKKFYITPPFEPQGTTTRSYHKHSEVASEFKKNRLEQFTMKRKEAFYITPPFDYETPTPEPDTDLPDESSDTGSEEENQDEESEETQENPRAIDKPDVKAILDVNAEATTEKQEEAKPVIDTQDLKNSTSKIANVSVISNDTDKLAANSYDYDITFIPDANQYVTPYISRKQQADADDKTLDELTRKQASIMKQLTDLKADKDNVNNYNQQFNNLRQALRDQKAWASSTVMIVLDETEVKNKLRGDPFVQRVLKMAKRRKDEYFRRAHAEALRSATKL